MAVNNFKSPFVGIVQWKFSVSRHLFGVFFKKYGSGNAVELWDCILRDSSTSECGNARSLDLSQRVLCSKQIIF